MSDDDVADDDIVVDVSEPIGNSCPGCGQPAVIELYRQSFCGNDDCHVFTWNPTMSLAELATDIGEIRLPDVFGEGQR